MSKISNQVLFRVALTVLLLLGSLVVWTRIRTQLGVVEGINQAPFNEALTGLGLEPRGNVSFLQRSPAWRSSVVLWFKTERAHLPDRRIGFDVQWNIFAFKNTRARAQIPLNIELPGVSEDSDTLQMGGVRSVIVKGREKKFALSFAFIESESLLVITIHPL